MRAYTLYVEQVGFEYLYWKNKYGVEGVNESVFQPSIRWTF